MWAGVSECACSTSGDISLNHLSFKNFQFGHISILGNSCCFATELNHYWFFFFMLVVMSKSNFFRASNKITVMPHICYMLPQRSSNRCSCCTSCAGLPFYPFFYSTITHRFRHVTFIHGWFITFTLCTRVSRRHTQSPFFLTDREADNHLPPLLQPLQNHQITWQAGLWDSFKPTLTDEPLCGPAVCYAG